MKCNRIEGVQPYEIMSQIPSFLKQYMNFQCN